MGNSLAKTLTMSRGGGNWDKHISIFSNSGRLYQVEYTFRAARTSGFTSLALKGEGCAVVLTQKKVPEQLMDPATVSNLHTITPTVGCVTTGRAPDSRAQIARARQTAHKHEYDFGYAMPVDYLASRIAASNQTYTQQAGTRPAAVFLMFVAIDDEKGPLVYKVDPAGFTASYKATCAGDKEVETNSALEKLYRDGDNDGAWDLDSTIKKAISTIQNVLSSDFKPTELEIGYVSVDNPEFTQLSVEDIEGYLNAIAEED